MQFPDFLRANPSLDIPLPDRVVTTRAVQSDRGSTAIFTFHEVFVHPPHSHKAQWGVVPAGLAEFTIGGVTRRHGPGQAYDIPSGIEHGGRFVSGTVCMDLRAEPDRDRLRE